MRYLLNICGSLIILTFCIPAWAQMPTYNVGRTPTPEEIRAADTAIGPEGKELPPGSGTAKQGAPIFAQKCAACHGPSGEGTNFSAPCGCSRLVGGKGTITTANPIVTVGSFWPFATTIWDFINRAMPFNKPGSLTADEVYALTAFLLYRNGIIQETDLLDAKSLPKVQMPNRNGFVPANPQWEQVRKPGPFGVYP